MRKLLSVPEESYIQAWDTVESKRRLLSYKKLKSELIKDIRERLGR